MIDMIDLTDINDIKMLLSIVVNVMNDFDEKDVFNDTIILQDDESFFEKAVIFDINTVRTWNGVDYKKIARNKWVRLCNNTKSIKKLKDLLSEQRSLQGDELNEKIDNLINNNNWCKKVTSHNNAVYYDESKDGMKDRDFQKEIKHASVFADAGCDVYLLKEEHGKYGVKNIDALINGVLVEFKYVEGSRSTAGRAYGRGLEQCQNIAMYVSSLASDNQHSYISKLNGTAKMSNRKKGLLIMYFERTNRLLVKDMRKF